MARNPNLERVFGVLCEWLEERQRQWSEVLVVCVSAETKAGAILGYAVMMHGIDNTITGAKQMWTGGTQRSLTQKGITAGAKVLGTNSSTTEQIGDYGDAAIGVFAALKLRFIGKKIDVYQLM